MGNKVDFKLVGSRRTVTHNNGKETGTITTVDKPEVIEPEVLDNVPSTTTNDTHPLTQAVADNFPKILDIATQCVDILKIREMSEAQIKELREKRESLVVEADAYVKKKNADTDSFKTRGETIRLLLEDYYKYGGTEKLPAEDFIKILEKTLNLQNGEIL